MRVIHLASNVFVQLLIVDLSQMVYSVYIVLLRGTDHIPRHHNTDLPDARDIWIKERHFLLLFRQYGRNRFPRREDHAGGHLDCFAKNGAQPYAGEDVHVVALAWMVDLVLVTEWRERGAGREEGSAVGMCDSCFEGAF